MKLRLRLTVACLAALAFLWTTGELAAQTVPHHARGTGVYSPIFESYEVQGVGTHLGRHTGFGDIGTSPTSDPFVQNFFSTGPQVWVAADGSTLESSLSGQVQLIPLDATGTIFTAIWTGEFTIEGGTRRFKNSSAADEPLQVVAINLPFTLTDPEWLFVWHVQGRFNLR